MLSNISYIILTFTYRLISDIFMVEEFKLTKIGGSKHLRVPHEFIKVYELDNYIYMCEVSKDGKTITYRRMREIKKHNVDNS